MIKHHICSTQILSDKGCQNQSTMKKMIETLAMLLLVPFVMSSCEKDDTDTTTPPEIYEFTAGTHPPNVNDTIVHETGAEIILDFSARSVNDGRLDAYHIEIHDHPESGNPADEYKIIDERFDDDPNFKGLRNASVHKHLAIPGDAPLGEYHVEVIVIDEYGNSTMVDKLLYLVEDNK